MVIAFIIAVSKRVGCTDIFQKGEILVRSNLMDLGEYIIIQLRNFSLAFLFYCFSLVIDMCFLTRLRCLDIAINLSLPHLKMLRTLGFIDLF